MRKDKNTASGMLQVLSNRSFQNSKGRNLVAVLAIAMTTLMFTTLFTLALSMRENLIEMTFRQAGYDAQVSIDRIEPEQAALLKNHPDVAQVGESIVLGVAENDKLSGRQVEIRWADENYAAHSFGLPTTGRMPESADELALDTITLNRLGIPHEVGQKVTLQWRTDFFDREACPVQSTFTLCGFWEGNNSSYASMAWVGREFADEMTKGNYNQENGVLGQYMAQLSLRRDTSIEERMNRILSDTGLTDLEYGVNLAYSPEMGATAVQETLPMYYGMVLVFIAGYLIIYNIFQISVTAEIQFYGKLKTLGTTTRQIRRLIFGQSNRLCLLGIPLGVFCGWLLGVRLVPVFIGVMEGGSRVSMEPVIFLGSAVFAWATVIISCLRPARLAGKVSPVEALRMSDADSGYRRKFRKNKRGASIPGMAWANLGRNKKRTVTVVCSLTLSFVLLSAFYAKDAAFDMEKYLESLTIADIELADASSENYIGGYNPQGKTLNAALVEAMETSNGVETVGHQYSHQFTWQMDEQTLENLKAFYTPDILEDWASYDSAGVESFRKAIDSAEVNAVVFGLDGIPLETITQSQYLMDGTFDAEAFSGGDYVLAIGPAVDMDTAHSVLPVPAVGSSILLEGRYYTVMAIVYPINPVNDGASEGSAEEGNAMELHFILPADLFRLNWPENTLRKLFVNVDDEHLTEALEWLDDYTKSVDSSLPVVSRRSMAAQYERQRRSAAVMGSVISVVIALVGVLNFINSMVTAILSRKREFAMIQSVGMTKRQLCGMMICEGLYYALITVAVSFALSALTVGIVIRAMVSGGFTTFKFTLMPLAVCSPVLIVLAVLIPCLCFWNLEKQSIVERLRTTD